MTLDTATTSTDAILAMWREGLLSSDDALRVLADDLRTLDDGLAVLIAQRDALCQHLVTILDTTGGPAAIPGLGEVAVTVAPAPFDIAAVEALIVSLARSHPTIASRLAACRRTTARRTLVRVTSETVTI